MGKGLKPFPVMLLIIVYTVLGILGLLWSLILLTAPLPREVFLRTVAFAVVSVGYLVAAYGLYRREKWGWLLALALVLLDLATGTAYKNMFTVVFDCAVIGLLLYTAGYYGLGFKTGARKPTPSMPTPSSPVAVAFKPWNGGKRRFVKKK